MTTTSYCYCWSIVRRDGQGFFLTDHDRELTFDSNTFKPVDGVLTTQITTSLGLEIDELSVEGAVSDDSIDETDLEAGLFDEATVIIYLVDWNDITDRKVLVTGNLGNMTLNDYGFETDFNSLANKLGKTVGEAYQRTCTAELGDSECGVDLTSATYRTTATITAAGELSVEVDDLSSYDNGWFVLGQVVTPTGAKYGIRGQTDNRIELWEAPFPALEVGQVLTITTGCKKSPGVCADKFSNIINFRGYGLFMPGQDALTEYPVRGEKNYNGGSLFN